MTFALLSAAVCSLTSSASSLDDNPTDGTADGALFSVESSPTEHFPDQRPVLSITTPEHLVAASHFIEEPHGASEHPPPASATFDLEVRSSVAVSPRTILLLYNWDQLYGAWCNCQRLAWASDWAQCDRNHQVEP